MARGSITPLLCATFLAVMFVVALACQGGDPEQTRGSTPVDSSATAATAMPDLQPAESDQSPTQATAQSATVRPLVTQASQPTESVSPPTPTAVPVTTTEPEPTAAPGQLAPSTTQSTATPEGSFATLLEIIPNEVAYRIWLAFNDFERARDLHGISLPGENATDDELIEYIVALSNAGMYNGPWISGYTDYAVTQLQNRGHMGFDLGNVDQSISIGEPPKTLEAVRGRFDPDATGAALRQCSECPEPDRLEHLGIEFYGWGEDSEVDLSMSHHPPAFDYLGRGGRIAVMDSHVLRALETQDMRGFIASYRAEADSLADNPDLALGAQILDELGAYSALLIGERLEQFAMGFELGTNCLTEEACNRVKAHFDESDALDKYEVLGAGVGFDDGGLFIGLVFIYTDQKVAERNVEILRDRLATGVSVWSLRPWSEFFPETLVWHEGNGLVAKLRTENPSMWFSIVANVDTLLWHK